MGENKMNNEELEAQVKKFVAEYLKSEIEKEQKKYPEDKNKYPKNTASLTLGILSIIFNLMWYISIPTGVLAIVFGVKGTKLTGSRVAKAGMICGIVGTALCLVIYLGITCAYLASEYL